MRYDTGKHTVYYHRFHIVWLTKYRYKVLRGALRERVRDIIRQVCEELGVTIVSGVLSSDHVHTFVSIPPQFCVSDVVRRVKGRSSRKIQQEFPDIRKRYWGCRFWARGTSARQAAMSPTTSYFATSKATPPNLPASAGSRLVFFISSFLHFFMDLIIN
jgi:putative transposase